MKNESILFVRLDTDSEQMLQAIHVHEASKGPRFLSRKKLIELLIKESFENRNLTVAEPTPDALQQSS